MRFFLLVIVSCVMMIVVTQRVSAQTETESKLGVVALPTGCRYQQIQCIQAPCDPLVVCEKTVPETEPLPEGCSYQQVQCVQAPCDPILMCTKPPVQDPPAGCYYQQVQCFQAPCDPQLICPATNDENTCAGNPDQNGDGNVNLLDYTILVNAFQGQPQLSSQSKSDINCDGRINLLDYTLLVNAFQQT